MVELVPATAAHVQVLYGKSLPVTIIGIAGVEDGRLLGLGAIYFEQGCMVATCRFSDEAKKNLRRYARAIFVGGRRLLGMASRYHLPVRARSLSGDPRAERLLLHLGFRPIEKDIFEWTASA